MIRTFGLLMLLGNSVLLVGNAAEKSENLDLPKSKLDIVQCQKEVLALHPGEVVGQKIVDTGAGGSEIHFEIHDMKATDWLVICDGTSAKILKAIKLDAER